MQTIYFDIETGPGPEEQIGPWTPEFMADKRLKDPRKIQTDLETKRQEWLDHAALDPRTARILAIGYVVGDNEDVHVIIDEERLLLLKFWNTFREVSARWVGWNIESFDLPMLVRRALAHGIEPPAGLVQGGRYWTSNFIDAMKSWNGGDFKGKWWSLDDAARFLGVGQKNGDGAQFAQLLATDPKAAREYLENDVRMTRAVAERIPWLRTN